MRGTLYAATEIVVFLLIATFIGVVIGRFWSAAARRTAPAASATPPPAEPADTAALAEVASLKERLAAAEAEKADMAKQLSIVEWQVTTLEEELAKDEPADAGA